MTYVYNSKLKPREYEERNTCPEKKIEPAVCGTQDLLIASQMLYHLSYSSQVEEEHFIDECLLRRSGKFSCMCLSLLGITSQLPQLLCMCCQNFF